MGEKAQKREVVTQLFECGFASTNAASSSSQKEPRFLAGAGVLVFNHLQLLGLLLTCMTSGKKKKYVPKGFEAAPFKCSEESSKRFLSNIKASHKRNRTKCWIWQACLNSSGYGSVLISSRKVTREDGSTVYRTTRVGAHRYSWLYHSKQDEIPKGMLVLHKCGERRCVNPDHLYLGDHRDNMNDMKLHGNYHKGSAHAKAVLTERDVYNIRVLYANGNITHRELGQMYGVHPAGISFICRGETWTHVGGPRKSRQRNSLKENRKPYSRRRFTAKQVKEIRRRYNAGEACPKLGEEFGVSHQSIVSIAKRRTYKDIE